eukprot:scpid67821/ scgid8704/ Transmembrane protein 181
MEQCIQLRLHTLTKRQYLLVFSAFFVALIITITIGVTGPKVLSSSTQHLGVEWSAVRLNETDAELVYSGRSPPGWSRFSQEFWLKCIIHVKQPLSGDADQDSLKFKMRVLKIRAQDGSQVWSRIYLGIERFQHTKSLHCEKTCEPFVLLHVGSVDHTRYEVEFAIEEANHPESIQNMTFEWQFFSPEFTQMEIWCQFVYIIFTFITAFQFMRSVRPFSIRDWCLEQKWISVLLVLLILFNNPLYPLHFLVNQMWGERFFEVLFRSTFVCAMLLFWLCNLHAVNVSPRKLTTFYLPKVIVVGLVWLASLTLLAWEEFNLLSDPSYQLHLDTDSFQAWKIVFYVSIGAYLFYLAYALFRAFGAQSPIDIRLKFFTSLMAIVVITSCTIMFVRFGTETLQPNFMSSYSPNIRNTAEFLVLIGVFNYYIYTMAYVYSPSPGAVKDTEMKGKTSFSRLYNLDADEDGAYMDQQLVDYDDDETMWKRSDR